MRHGEHSEAFLVLPDGKVKREMAAEQPQGEEAAAGAGAGAMIAVATEGDGGFEKVEISMRIDMAVLHCPLCQLPLKPPIYQCTAAGHLACGSCHGGAAGKRCYACDAGDGGGVYARCPAMDTFVRSAKVVCPYDMFGCRSYVAYYDVAGHQRECRHAPCACPEHGCGFLGSPPMLLAHLVADHAWPVSKLRYGEVLTLHVAESERRHLLVAGGGEQVFVVSVGAISVARAVSVSCVRANAAAAATRFRCKLWAHGGGAAEFVHMETAVASSAAAGGGEVGEEGMFLTVPPCLLHRTCKEMLLKLSIRIDMD
uniref:SIAH-type domain-containing protein n=1 Tax=Leersia perrieri TaxID=77586 RepID=A0A0D9UW77_9ORYZ